MSEWKTVDSAPNGVPVLIAAPDRWGTKQIVCSAEREHRYWSVHGASGYEIENDFLEPTHWMPLPPPPNEGEPL